MRKSLVTLVDCVLYTLLLLVIGILVANKMNFQLLKVISNDLLVWPMLTVFFAIIGVRSVAAKEIECRGIVIKKAEQKEWFYLLLIVFFGTAAFCGLQFVFCLK